MGIVAVELPIRIGKRAESRDAAAGELFTAHYPRLAGWIAGLVGDREIAHDIATESFTRLLVRWEKVDEPRAYLYVVATNLVRDHWRSLDRERRALSLVGSAEPVAHPVDTGVRDLVLRLPDRLREPVLLHYYADLPVAEVARLLHKAEGTVKRALFDARALLHGALTRPEDTR